MDRPKSDPEKPGGVEGFVGVVVGLVFAGMGLAMIAGLGMMSSGFGAPPPFFRFVFTLMGLAFVAIGGGMAWKSLQGLSGDTPECPFRSETFVAPEDRPTTTSPPVKVGYVCPRCGAPLADKADVSPHGDVKCGYCASWFNIHQA